MYGVKPPNSSTTSYWFSGVAALTLGKPLIHANPGTYYGGVTACLTRVNSPMHAFLCVWVWAGRHEPDWTELTFFADWSDLLLLVVVTVSLLTTETFGVCWPRKKLFQERDSNSWRMSSVIFWINSPLNFKFSKLNSRGAAVDAGLPFDACSKQSKFIVLRYKSNKSFSHSVSSFFHDFLSSPQSVVVKRQITNIHCPGELFF